MPNDFKANEVNHVYILGAGFSKPLGCPLFTELFAASYNRVVPHLDFRENPGGWILGRIVQDLPSIYNRLNDISGSTNAEQFLELCDSARLPQYNWFTNAFIKSLVWLESAYKDADLPWDENDVFELGIIGTRIRLALETNHMVTSTPDASERWIPYMEWFRGLGKSDTIISLNYDLLVETAATKTDRAFPGRNFIAKEDVRSVDDFLAQNMEHLTLPLLCKLHGSVDWVLRNDTAFVKRYSIYDYFEGLPPLLGTPGAGKRSLSGGCLKKVWSTAVERLREAHVISIVGCSLPETDNDFRIKLLDSIIKSTGNLKVINIVLGQPTPHSQRARAILEQAIKLNNLVGKSIKVKLLPIYAQDYLPYYRPTNDTEISDHAFPGV